MTTKHSYLLGNNGFTLDNNKPSPNLRKEHSKDIKESRVNSIKFKILKEEERTYYQGSCGRN